MKRVAGVRSVAAVVALALLVLAGSARAQNGAVIAGRGTNGQGRPVANATSSAVVPFSVGRVDSTQLKEVPASSPIAALAGKVSGVKVAIGTGNPGAAPTIRLRGSTNLGIGTSSPLVIIDGVITKYN